MVLRTLALAGLGALVAAAVGGCGDARGSGDPPRPTVAPRIRSSVPALSDQIARAQRVGPVWLDYCPDRPGRARATFDLIQPGGGTLPGWCRTSAARRALGDYVTFVAHWDDSAGHGGTGTATLVYLVPRGVDATATPVPLLVSQSGQLPP